MLMYPGGEENPERDHDIVTYNLYYDTIKPGGHCACLVAYPDSSILRYDVQGGSQWIRTYTTKESSLREAHGCVLFLLQFL